jgi:hypothetical protein
LSVYKHFSSTNYQLANFFLQEANLQPTKKKLKDKKNQHKKQIIKQPNSNTKALNKN